MITVQHGIKLKDKMFIKPITVHRFLYYLWVTYKTMTYQEIQCLQVKVCCMLTISTHQYAHLSLFLSLSSLFLSLSLSKQAGGSGTSQVFLVRGLVTWSFNIYRALHSPVAHGEAPQRHVQGTETSPPSL